MSSEYFMCRPQSNARRMGRMKAVLLLGATMVGLLAWYMSTLNSLPPIAIYMLYGAGLFDAVLALVLPGIIEKQILALGFHFFNDRMEITFGESARMFILPYDNIESVEDIGTPSDAELGLTAVRLRTKRPIRVPRNMGGDQRRLVLNSLPRQEMPFDRIKELVEKSRPA